MTLPSVRVLFRYCPGLLANPFRNVRLCGSWDASGRAATQWSNRRCEPTLDDDGRSAFTLKSTSTKLRSAPCSTGGCSSTGSSAKTSGELQRRSMTRPPRRASDPSRWRRRTQRLSHRQRPTTSLNAVGWAFGSEPNTAGIRFSLWAPNARSVDLVFVDPAHGYIADNGVGAVQSSPMTRPDGGIWQARLDSFAGAVGRPYMFRVTKDDGTPAYRTDLWSYKQIGAGDVDPGGQPYTGSPAALEGPQSCSVVCDPRRIAALVR